MILVAYTNSNCEDLWEVFRKQTLKHSSLPLYLITDKYPNNQGIDGIYVYENTQPYYDVWSEGLAKFDSEYFIYLQEDFFLYSDINYYKLFEYWEFLKNNPEYSFVRLIKSGNLGNKKITETLYEIEPENENIFAMQASIWRTSDYVKLMQIVKDDKWLENDNYRNAMISNNMKGVYHYDNEPLRGLAHTDSNVFPYIATALVKGKWNMSEYPNELGDILTTNNINVNTRGIY